MPGKEQRVIVTLNGGGPWGFRLQGGAGTGLPLIVSKVRRKSKAYRRLREGDRILSVNGRSCEGLTYDQLMDIADKSGTDLTLEVLRRECDKENQAPKQESTTKMTNEMEKVPTNKEIVSFTETTKKTTEEKEGLRIKSATVVPESAAFENFKSSKLEERPKEQQVVEPFPSFKDLAEPRSDSCSSFKKESVTGDDKNYTKTTIESKHEVKGGTETSFMKKEQESVSKSISDIHGMPDITLDTIDLNNLISETQKRLDSFRNNFKTNGVANSSKSEIKKTGIISSSKTSESKTFETSNAMSDMFTIKDTTDLTKKDSTDLVNKDSIDLSIKDSKDLFMKDSLDLTIKDGVGFIKTDLTDTTTKDGTGFIKTDLTDMTTKDDTGFIKTDLTDVSKVDAADLIKAYSTDLTSKDSTDLKQNAESVVLQENDAPAKKIPPPTLPKPKIQSHPTFDAFKDCLKEMEMDPIFELPDLGFTSQSSESSTITQDIPFGTSTLVTKKKKMFSSSSFYEEPHDFYPTIEEQVEMARKIADSLADDTNKKSKGANMFYKRVKRSTKWIHEGPEPSDGSIFGTSELQGAEPPTPDPSQVPYKPSKGPLKLKLILNPTHPLDLEALRASGYVISEHNAVSPEVCHGLVKDLHSPVGKGAALFAKRKKKSEEWVVDEEKVKALLREQQQRAMAPPLSTSPALNQYSSLGRQEVKLVKSPWEAAMQSPYGFCDSAFARVNPDQLADTVMRAADYKRSESLSRESSRMEGCISPPVPQPATPAAAMYDVYHAKAPKGWAGSTYSTDYSSLFSSSPLPQVQRVSSNTPQQMTNMQNGLQQPRKMVFQNFNTVPRLWKGTSVQ